MHIEIVNYEQGRFNGILSKFADKLNEQLVSFGEKSSIVAFPTGRAQITHHINYLPYKHENSPDSINTLMVTHFNYQEKVDALKIGLETADMGVCFSSSMPKWLESKGLPKDKLAHILPAHDGKPRRHQIVAILTNVYPDGCKRAEMLEKLAKTIDNNQFAFRIMGSGWEDILPGLVANGLQVDYFHDFNPEIHQKILETSDFALYFGEDEGSMGLLDAVNAGVKVIGTPQGFHLDMGLDYSFNTQEELDEIFKNLIPPNRVKMWTWEIFAKQHLNLWKDLLSSR